MSIDLMFKGEFTEVYEGIKNLRCHYNFVLDEDGIIVNVTKSDSKIEVSYNNGVGYIKYSTKNNFFRGLGTLLEAIRANKDLESVENPQFDSVGTLLDCSRNGVLKVNKVKEIIEVLAVMGINLIALYTEDTYTIEDEKYFGYMRGRYSYNELKELDDYAYTFGIEMIPCIQTLGHLEQFLKWEASGYLKENSSVLLTGEDTTYDFIKKMLISASAPYRSRRIHIGMDEAAGLGLGRYLQKHGYRNSFELMNEHLASVIELAKSCGLSTMIWSDMYFSIASKTGDYYDRESVIPIEVSEIIPKDVQLVYWDYTHHDEAAYSYMINKHKEMGYTPVFAGGIWTWTGFCTNYGRTLHDSNAALLACKKEGVKEVIATTWGDDGMENNHFTSLLGMQIFAEHAYAEKLDIDVLKRKVGFCTGVDYDAYMDMRYLDEITESIKDNLTSLNPSKYLLWQDILLGLFDKHIGEIDTVAHYSMLEIKMRNHKKNNERLEQVLYTLEKLCSVLKIKADMGIRIKRYYEAGDKVKLEEIAVHELPILCNEIIQLKTAHRTAWMQTYKPFGWEVIDLRYGGLLSRVTSTIDRLQDYINDKVENIEELEAERLYFSKVEDKKRTTLVNSEVYGKIVTPNAF